MQVFSYLKNQFRHMQYKKIEKKNNFGVILGKISMVKKIFFIFKVKLDKVKKWKKH